MLPASSTALKDPRLACRLLERHGPGDRLLPRLYVRHAGRQGAGACGLGRRERARHVASRLRRQRRERGDFEAGTLASWRDDALAVIEAVVPDRDLVLVGSSMGGWIALLLGEALGNRLAGLVGLAARDFTEWGFDEWRRAALRRDGKLVEATPYGDSPYVTTLAFCRSGQALRLLGRKIEIDAPVRLLQEQADPDVALANRVEASPRNCVQPTCGRFSSRTAITDSRVRRTSPC